MKSARNKISRCVLEIKQRICAAHNVAAKKYENATRTENVEK